MSDAAEAVAATEAAPAAETTTDTTADYGGAELAEAMDAGDAGPEAWSVDALPEDMAGRLVEMKVNGEVIRVPLAEALKGSQRMKAATQKEMAAAERVREAEARARAFLEDPMLIAKEGGEAAVESAVERWVNSEDPAIQKALERVFSKLVQDSQMTPEQRQRAERERALEAREAKYREWEEQQQAEQSKAATQAATEDYRARISAALEARGVPVTPHSISRTAMAIQGGLDSGVDMDPADAVELVYEERQSEYGAELGALEGDALLSRLGPDLVRKINQATVARIKSAKQRPAQQASAPEPAREGEPHFLTPAQARKKWGMGPGSW